MNLKAFASIAGIGLLLISSSSIAGVSPYVGASAIFAFVDDSNFRDTGTVIDARGTFGADFSPYLGAEIHGGVGVDKDSVVLKNPDEKANVKLNNYYGVYGKGILPIDPTMNVYGLLGLARSSTVTSAGGSSSSQDGSDLSYGVGVDVKISDNARFMIDGIVLRDKSALTIGTLSAGVKWIF